MSEVTGVLIKKVLGALFGILLFALPSSAQFTGPSPWVDATAYGAVSRSSFLTTNANTTQKSTSVSLTSPGAIDFVNGDGIVIWTAGNPTTQSTPSAPTVTSPAVQGSATINYKIVGVDAMGGLTAASAAGSVTNAPAVFAPKETTITSISQSSGVVTVNTSSALGGLVNGKVWITNTSGIANANGLQTIASISGTQFTYNLSGNAGSGTVSGTTTARLCNSFAITTISRSGTTISITTDQSHGYKVQSGNKHTLILVNGVDQQDLNGYYIVLTASGRSITASSAISATETGTLNGTGANAPTVTVFEYNTVICPTYAGTTVAYYIYADYANKGTYVLIGKTPPSQTEFKDYGPFFNSGFAAPGYVPTTPPIAAQNQLFVSTILSGGGTTSLVLKDAVPSQVSGQINGHNSTMHDEGRAILAACNAINGAFSKTVFLPPNPNGSYIINAPLTIPLNIDLTIGGALVVNETIRLGGYNKLIGDLTVSRMVTPQFTYEHYVGVTGLANPAIWTGTGTTLEGFSFSGDANGLNTVFVPTIAGFIRHSLFSSGSNSMSIPLVFQAGSGGGGGQFHLTNCAFTGYFGHDGTQKLGQGFSGPPPFGPSIPVVLFRQSETGSGTTGSILMDGENVFAGRAILIDGTFTGITGGPYSFNIFEFQAPSTPTVMVYGQSGQQIYISYAINDSLGSAILANWTSLSLSNVELNNVSTSPWTVNAVTGNAPIGLVLKNSPGQVLGQNVGGFVQRQSGAINVGAGAVQGSVTRQGESFIMSGATPPPLAVQIPQIIGVTATTAGNTSNETGTHTFNVTAVGWNGGEGAISNGTSYTFDGTHGVTIAWHAISGGIQGYNVYLDNAKQNPSIITTNSFLMGNFSNNGGSGSIDGTGVPLIDSTQVATPLLRLTNGLFKADASTATLSANRAYKFPNATGTIALTIASGAATLGTSAIASNSCASVVTVAAAGVLTTDAISWSFNADPKGVTGYGAGSTGTLSIWAFPTANNVNFRVCNLGGSSITPRAATLNWRVVR